jgi:hypothetical protein
MTRRRSRSSNERPSTGSGSRGASASRPRTRPVSSASSRPTSRRATSAVCGSRPTCRSSMRFRRPGGGVASRSKRGSSAMRRVGRSRTAPPATPVSLPASSYACASPEWQAYLHEQVLSAVGSGVDGILYDNVGTGCQCPRCENAFRSYAHDRSGRAFDELPEFGHAAVGIVSKVQRVVGVEPTGPRPDEQATWLWRQFVDTSLAEQFAELADAAHALRPRCWSTPTTTSTWARWPIRPPRSCPRRTPASPGWPPMALGSRTEACCVHWSPARMAGGRCEPNMASVTGGARSTTSAMTDSSPWRHDHSSVRSPRPRCTGSRRRSIRRGT